jgi:hypothetical protein
MPRRFRHDLPGHDVRTVQEMGWAGVENGRLLQLANGRFEALLILHQQALAGLAITVVILEAASNDIDDIRPLAPHLLAALQELAAGTVVIVRRPQSSSPPAAWWLPPAPTPAPDPASTPAPALRRR